MIQQKQLFSFILLLCSILSFFALIRKPWMILWAIYVKFPVLFWWWKFLWNQNFCDLPEDWHESSKKNSPNSPERSRYYILTIKTNLLSLTTLSMLCKDDPFCNCTAEDLLFHTSRLERFEFFSNKTKLTILYNILSLSYPQWGLNSQSLVW